MRAGIGPVIAFAQRSYGQRLLVGVVGWRLGSLGLTLHRSGGFSISGIPRRGGTTIAWGARLQGHMDELAEDCTRIPIGPVVVYCGTDF